MRSVQSIENDIYLNVSHCIADISIIDKNLHCSVLFYQNRTIEFSFLPNLDQELKETQNSPYQLSKYEILLDLNYSVRIAQEQSKIINGNEKKYFFKITVFILNLNSHQKLTIKWNSQSKISTLRAYFNTCTWLFENLRSKYDIVREIYDKEDQKNNRKFVLIKNLKTFENRLIKIYSLKDMMKSQSQKMDVSKIIHEIQFQNMISHPNIMRFNKFLIDDHYFYLFYEQKPSKMMSEYRKKGNSLPAKRIKQFMRQMLGVLEQFHEAGIIHRNLRLSSMFVIEDNQKWKVSLGEFEYANFARGQRGPKIDEEEKYFLAPELLEKNDFYLQRSHLSDVFSLGLVFYELLFGDELFTNKMLKKRIQNAPFELPIEDTLTSYPTLDLLEQLLQYDPKKRITPTLSLEHDYFTRLERTSTHKNLNLLSFLCNQHETLSYDTTKEIRVNEVDKKDEVLECMTADIPVRKMVMKSEKMYQSHGRCSFKSSPVRTAQTFEEDETWDDDDYEVEQESVIRVRDVSMMKPGWKAHGCESTVES